MQIFRIRGGLPIRGESRILGAKNAVLPLLAASVLIENGQTRLENCPKLKDIENMLQILRALGCKVLWTDGAIEVDASGAHSHRMPQELSKQIRSSIFMLGPILARFGQAEFTYPGGCEIGLRPIDLHLSSLRAMGAEIHDEQGILRCKGRLHGAQIHLDYPSVGATENILMAAVFAEGETTIFNAAREPEVRDLARFLNRCGAGISGAGGGTIRIAGGRKLHGCVYSPLTDRIVAGTLLLAAAITRGDVFARGARAEDMQAVLSKLRQAGCTVSQEKQGVRVQMDTRPRAVRRVETNPYPSFPTDMQAQMMALLSVAGGTSVLMENVFENRFAHAGELMRMGADIELSGRLAVIRGVDCLYGRRVSSRDLRGGAALVLASLAAREESIVDHISYIDRGYECLEKTLARMGADIVRADVEEQSQQHACG